MHNGAVRADWSPNNIIGIFQIDDHSLGRSVCFVVDLAHAYVLVGLECLASLVSASTTYIVYVERTYAVLP